MVKPVVPDVVDGGCRHDPRRRADGPTGRPCRPGPDHRRKATDWGIVGAVAAAVALRDGPGVVDPGRAPAGPGDRVAAGRAPVSRGLRRRAEALGAGPRAGPPRPRGGRQRPPALDHPGRAASHDDDPAGILSRSRPPADAGRTEAMSAARRTPAATTPGPRRDAGEISPLRKAAIVLVSLEQSLASQLLSHLDRSAVEMVTWEIARLDRIDPERARGRPRGVLRPGPATALLRLRRPGQDGRCRHPRGLPRGGPRDLGAGAGRRRRRRCGPRCSGALPASASDALQRQLEHLGPFRLSDSEAAQLEIADRLRRLYDRGRISLPEPNGSDEVLV